MSLAGDDTGNARCATDGPQRCAQIHPSVCGKRSDHTLLQWRLFDAGQRKRWIVPGACYGRRGAFLIGQENPAEGHFKGPFRELGPMSTGGEFIPDVEEREERG